MKNIKLLLTIFGALFILSMGCKKSNEVNTTPSDTNNIVTSGTWEITSFTQRTEDKTSDFSGLNFTFSNDAKLVVTGSENITGSWSSANGFSINLGTGSPFKRLSRGWIISSQTNTVLKLDAAESAEDEHVTFTKK